MKILLKYTALLLTLCAGELFAQGGVLDNTFGAEGKITTDIRMSGNDFIYSIALLPDEKILVAGATYNGTTYDFALARYLNGGALDGTFGNNGKVMTDFSGGNDYALSMALQADGSIVIAGYTIGSLAASGDFAVARYLPDGTPDYTFGNGGKRTTALSGAGDFGRTVLLQPDGKIVVAGYVYFNTDYDFAVVRYLPDGTLDNSFGNAGIVISAIGDYNDYALTAALQPDGKILLGGEARTPGVTTTDFTLVRYLPNGAPDASFATEGILFMDFDNNVDRVSSIALQPDGKIILAGVASNGVNFDFALARYLPDGNRDYTFDNDARVITAIGDGDDYAQSVVVQPDGRIVVAGYSQHNGVDYDFALARYLPDGALDGSFSPQETVGVLTTAIGAGEDRAYATALLPDEKIIVAGFSSNGTDLDFALARYNTTGNLDAGFGTDGIQTTPIGNSGEAALDCAIQPDGKIVAVGTTSAGTSDFGLARYQPNGALDNSFGNDGKLFTDFDFKEDFAVAVAIQPDGKLVVGGRSGQGSIFDFSLARYLPDGALDTNFGADGRVLTSFGAASDMGRALVLQPDNKIILAGYTTSGNQADFALARYLPNGNPDNTFGTAGMVTTSIGTGADFAYALALQPDGKIILGGSTSVGTDKNFALVRYLPSGAPDPGFGNGGVLVQSLSAGQDEINSIALQPDGKIVAAGVTFKGIGQDFALTRYLPDGTPDAGFGNNGIVITDFGGTDVARAVALHADGRIVAGGFNQPGGQVYDFALACYLPDGSPDTTFSTDGLLTTDFDAGIDQINTITIQADGKIVAAGYSVKGTDRDFALARYLPGLNVGVLDFSVDDHSVLVYPNPIVETAILKYTLTRKENISIRLLDAQGKLVRTFVEFQEQPAGDQEQVIVLPEALSSGWYVLIITGDSGEVRVKIIK